MRTLNALVLISLLTAAGASAQHPGDIFLSIEGGRIVTGLIEGGEDRLPGDPPPSITSGVRVFASEFGEVAPNFTDEPGFDNTAGTFSPASLIGFNIRRALRAWNGSDFNTLSTEAILVGFGPLPDVPTPATDILTHGFSVPVDADGEWHVHLEYTLTAPAALGIYLLELELFSSDSAVGPSEPFWIVFNQNDSEARHDAAIEYVVQNIVPAPAAATGVMFAMVMLAGRRRR